jgi:hypothetical protein
MSRLPAAPPHLTPAVAAEWRRVPRAPRDTSVPTVGGRAAEAVQ